MSNQHNEEISNDYAEIITQEFSDDTLEAAGGVSYGDYTGVGCEATGIYRCTQSSRC